MSCIAGICNLDGGPVDSDLLERMTGAMSPRAPDALNIWVSGSVGFGHAMLRTSPESQHEQQPFTLDGKVWVCADARIDGRKDLFRKLRSHGAQVNSDATDPELILHSYHAIGNNFLDYIIGDFAFALWDERASRLICARDHFGVRPFFYLRTHDHFLFASHINALRLQPAATSQLDEGYIADILLFGECLDTEASAFVNIRRLPGSTVMTVEQGQIHSRKYWEVPGYQQAAKASDADYLAEFSEVFAQAVNDRVDADSTAIELSGGMDSGSIAAMLRSNGHSVPNNVIAHSVSCSNLFEDDEDQFTSLTASSLGIKLIFQQLSEYRLFQNPTCYLQCDEPHANANLAVQFDKWSRISATGTRVVLSGQGGDAAFAATVPDPSKRFKLRALGEFSGEVFRHFLHMRTLRGAGIRARFGRDCSDLAWRPPVPPWIAPEFARRTDIFDRWQSGWKRMYSPMGLHRQLNSGFRGSLFESYERPELALVVRHPFFDTRLVCYLLMLPNRLKSDKKLLRAAMTGRLPTQICTRPKTALAEDLVRAQLLKGSDSSVFTDWVSNECDTYVDRVSYLRGFDQYVAGSGLESTWFSGLLAAPVCLSLWLKGLGLKY